MSAKNEYKGWTLIHTIQGWCCAKGTERVYIAGSTAPRTKELEERFFKAVDERQ